MKEDPTAKAAMEIAPLSLVRMSVWKVLVQDLVPPRTECKDRMLQQKVPEAANYVFKGASHVNNFERSAILRMRGAHPHPTAE